MQKALFNSVLTICIAFAASGQAVAESPGAKQNEAANNAAIIEQAIPVAALLRSVKESDAACFLQCWDEPMAERMGLDAESAKKMIVQYRLGFDKVFGEYSMDGFSFCFVGAADAGAVTVKFKDKNFPPLKVVKRGNAWKLGEM